YTVPSHETSVPSLLSGDLREVVIEVFKKLRHHLLLPHLVPVLNQVNPRQDIDHLAILYGKNAGVAGQQQTIRLIQWYRDIELRQRLGHDFAYSYLRWISVVVQQPGQGHFLNAADRLAVVEDGQLREPGRLQQLDGGSSRRGRADRDELPSAPRAQQIADG